MEIPGVKKTLDDYEGWTLFPMFSYRQSADAGCRFFNLQDAKIALEYGVSSLAKFGDAIKDEVKAGWFDVYAVPAEFLQIAQSVTRLNAFKRLRDAVSSLKTPKEWLALKFEYVKYDYYGKKGPGVWNNFKLFFDIVEELSKLPEDTQEVITGLEQLRLALNPKSEDFKIDEYVVGNRNHLAALTPRLIANELATQGLLKP
jgi:hypothetical protein